jgi:hypothetical protein
LRPDTLNETEGEEQIRGPEELTSLMSKQAEAELILKLYELRREETMRKARDWYFLEFNPESLADYTNAVFGEHSGYVRMVSTYWDMAAALVNHGAISAELFNDANSEHYPVFAKLQPILGEVRAKYGPNFMKNLEQLISTTPGGLERVAATRERLKAVRAGVASARATSNPN